MSSWLCASRLGRGWWGGVYAVRKERWRLQVRSTVEDKVEVQWRREVVSAKSRKAWREVWESRRCGTPTACHGVRVGTLNFE
jgi:hypothetical protein